MSWLYRRKPAQVMAMQWFKNGDHPKDGNHPARDREGRVVRYYRHPDGLGAIVHEKCDRTWHDHGWIDQGPNGIVVCPGDWVIEHVYKDDANEYELRTPSYHVLDDGSFRWLYEAEPTR